MFRNPAACASFAYKVLGPRRPGVLSRRDPRPSSRRAHQAARSPPRTSATSESRVGRSHLHQLSRLDRLRAAAERPRHRRPAACSISFAISARHVPAARRRRAPRADRIAASGVRRSAALCCRHAVQQGAGRRADLDGVSRASAPSSSTRQRLQPDRLATLAHRSQRRSTIYLSVVDRDGNIVSLIQSLFRLRPGMVAGVRLPATESRRPLRDGSAAPNALAPRKRPFHTIIPAFMEKDNIHIGFGIMGGLNQAQAHAQFVSNVVDHGMNVQSALEQPRFTKGTFDGLDVEMEETMPEAVRAGLHRPRTPDSAPRTLLLQRRTRRSRRPRQQAQRQLRRSRSTLRRRSHPARPEHEVNTEHRSFFRGKQADRQLSVGLSSM